MHTEGEIKLLPGRNEHYVSVSEIDYEKIYQRCFYVCGPKSDSHFVADLIVHAGAEGQADAKRFVLCWNTHDKLLDALKRLCKEYVQNLGTKHEFISCITPDNIPDYWRNALAAIAAAEPPKG